MHQWRIHGHAHLQVQNTSWMGTLSLTDMIMEGEPGFDIPDLIKGKYNDDQFFKNIMEKPTHYKDSELQDGLLFMIPNGRQVLSR